MNKKELTKKSKFLSLILRHKPEEIGIVLDENGWAFIAEIIEKAGKKSMQYTKEEIVYIVENNTKKRFSISDDQRRIRANQGHSIAVNVELKQVVPTIPLYHGTAMRFLDSICEKGILAGNRLHVHLSDSKELAMTVGSRHGKAILLEIDVEQMVKAGIPFFLSENGVWLTDFVSAEYIKIHA